MSATRIVAIPDLHAPYHDKRAWDLALQVIDLYEPHHVVILGDFADCYCISDYPKDPRREKSLLKEIAVAAKLLNEVRGVAVAADISFMAGNHEDRLARYLAKRAPELHGLVSMQGLLGIHDEEWHDYGEELKIGRCHFVHDVGFCGNNAARKSLEAFGGNLVFGHAHRGEVVYDGNLRGERHFAVCSGWLGDASKIDYAKRTRVRQWQHGVTLVDQDAKGNSWATFVPFVGGKCIVKGTEIKL